MLSKQTYSICEHKWKHVKLLKVTNLMPISEPGPYDSRIFYKVPKWK